MTALEDEVPGRQHDLQVVFHKNPIFYNFFYLSLLKDSRSPVVDAEDKRYQGPYDGSQANERRFCSKLVKYQNKNNKTIKF